MISASLRLLMSSAGAAVLAAAAAPALGQDQAQPQVLPPVTVPAQDQSKPPPLIAPDSGPRPTRGPEMIDAPQDEGEDGEAPGTEVPSDMPEPPEADAEGVETAEAAEPPPVPIPAEWSPVPRDAEGRTAYGLYLGGRYLSAHGMEQEGEARAGAEALVQALALTPEQPTVAEQAFVSALLAGDLAGAVASTPQGDDVSPTLTGAARLVEAVLRFERGRAREAAELLKSQPIAPPHANAALLVQPWIAAAARDWNLALTTPPSGEQTLFKVMRLQRAQIFEMRRRYDEAESEYKALVEAPNSQIAFRVAYGEFLERRRRRDEAVALYAAAPPAEAASPMLVGARARAASGGRAPRLPTARQGASRALLLASNLARDLRAPQFAAVYSRLALEISPDDDHRLQYADALMRARLEGPAREELARVSPDRPALYTAAQAQLGDSLARAERQDEALEAYRRALAASPQSAAATLALASQLVSVKRNQEALDLIDGPVLGVGARTGFVHFLRGAALEGLGRDAEAEVALKAAVEAQPDQPMYLNFLGYLWVDNGTRVDEGAAMIARAFSAQPNDGNIQDSLGWAQYRQGRFEEAVATLEQAVEKQPANAEINDHLGDAYWRVGRRREAGFQWSRVLTLDPDADRKAEVERKLAEGLGPVETPAPAAAASSTEAGETVAGADAT